MDATLRNRLIKVSLALAIAGGGAALYNDSQPSPAVVLAQEVGIHFESGGRHIGTPYIDKIGKGQPLTVCGGITGKGVVANRYYTPDDCKKLEAPKYAEAERGARRLFKLFGTYNIFVQASLIDMVFNLGEQALVGSTAVRLANAGNLDGACEQMPRWVYGTVRGVKTQMNGLVLRRGTTRELCAEWGRDGHFSADLIAGAKP